MTWNRIALLAAALDVRSVPLTLSARLYLPTGAPVSLFGVAGAGRYHIICDYSESLEDVGAIDDSDTRRLDESVFDSVEEFDYDSTYFVGGLSFHF